MIDFGIENEMGDSSLKKTNKITLRLGKRERDLLLKYGYLFEDTEQQLERAAGTNGVVTISIDPFYAERLIGDLVYSAKIITDRGLLEELDALMTTIESRITFHSG